MLEFTAGTNDFCFSSSTSLLLKMYCQVLVSRKYLPTVFTFPSRTKHIHLLDAKAMASKQSHVYCWQVVFVLGVAVDLPPYRSCILPPILLWFIQHYIYIVVSCNAIKTNKFCRPHVPFFSNCYHHSIHALNLRLHYGFFLAFDFFYHG